MEVPPRLPRSCPHPIMTMLPMLLLWALMVLMMPLHWVNMLLVMPLLPIPTWPCLKRLFPVSLARTTPSLPKFPNQASAAKAKLMEVRAMTYLAFQKQPL